MVGFLAIGELILKFFLVFEIKFSLFSDDSGVAEMQRLLSRFGKRTVPEEEGESVERRDSPVAQEEKVREHI